jgi:hypothetical protein
MKKSPQTVFKDGLDKAFSGVKANMGTMTDHAIYKQGVTEDGTPMIRRSIKKLLHAKKKDVKEAEGYSDYYPGGKTPGLTADVLNTILTNIAKKGLDDKEDEEDRPKNRFRTPKKKETKEQDEVTEKWSEKYKKSIDCSSPKGFSQKAHCDGRKKETKEQKEKFKGGVADGKTLEDIAKKHDKKGYYHIDDMVSSLKKQLDKGIKVEMEHTKDKSKAREIAMDHLWEHPNYYDKLKKVESKEATGSGSSGAYSGPVFGGNDEFWERSRRETPKLKESDVEKVEATGSGSSGGSASPAFAKSGSKKDWKTSKKTQMSGGEFVEKVEAKEATTSGSVGGYESPSMWAKSTKKKDWGPSRKTQIPGGGFVKIKKKCTKFPYCNQGDISNVKISKNESVKEAIKNVARKTGVSESVIKTILEYEYEKISKRNK